MTRYVKLSLEPSKTWEDEAGCSAEIAEYPHMSAAWVDEETHLAEFAKEVCNTTCKVKVECLLAALADPEAQGIRGGVTFSRGSLSKSDSHLVRSLYGVRKTRTSRNMRSRIA